MRYRGRKYLQRDRGLNVRTNHSSPVTAESVNTTAAFKTTTTTFKRNHVIHEQRMLTSQVALVLVVPSSH